MTDDWFKLFFVDFVPISIYFAILPENWGWTLKAVFILSLTWVKMGYIHLLWVEETEEWEFDLGEAKWEIKLFVVYMYAIGTYFFWREYRAETISGWKRGDVLDHFSFFNWTFFIFWVLTFLFLLHSFDGPFFQFFPWFSLQVNSIDRSTIWLSTLINKYFSNFFLFLNFFLFYRMFLTHKLIFLQNEIVDGNLFFDNGDEKGIVL